MIVYNTQQGQAVLAQYRKLWAIRGHRYLSVDFETKGRPPHAVDDALIYGRQAVLVMTTSVFGHSYTFPTSWMDPRWPDEHVWARLFADVFADETVRKVYHNANYDVNVTHTAFQLPVRNVWCTMIGGWVAAEWMEKTLKARAPLLGRIIRATSTVDFGNLVELADYGESDVLATDELYQLQEIGHVSRPPHHDYVGWDPGRGQVSAVRKSNKWDAGRLDVPSQTFNKRKRRWMLEVELPVLETIIRAEQHGFPFSRRYLRKIRAEAGAEVLKLRSQITRMAGMPVNPNSGADLAKAFANLHIRNTRKTAKGKMSFDARTLVTLQDAHPFVKLLLRVKQLEKLVSVYIGTSATGPKCGLEYYINPTTQRIHTMINTVGAVTGRASSSNPNAQQIPNRKDIFHIRRCFRAGRDDKALGVLDYAQLELRIMALCSQDKTMCGIMRDPKGDMHTVTAERFGCDRVAAKQLNFLLQYAGKAYALAAQLNFMGIHLTEAQVEGYSRIYAKTYSGVVGYRKDLLREHREKGRVRLLLGRTRHLPDIDWTDHYSVHKAETTLSNNVIQGSGQDMLKAALVRADWRAHSPDERMLARYGAELEKEHKLVLADYAQRLKKLRRVLKLGKAELLLQVHDEVIVRFDKAAADECLNAWATIMTWRHYMPAIKPYSVPLVVEGGWGANWEYAKSEKKGNGHIKLGYEEWQRYAA